MRRPWAAPAVPLYRAGVRGKNSLYDRHWLKARRLVWPVVSIGSLSAGGAGKTPVVSMLADLLARHRIAVDVLSRGYGRSSGRAEKVDPDGLATTFGDEPIQMARAGLHVFVGTQRFEAGVLAENTAAGGQANSAPGIRLHLLDDGFQHRRLARALDIVLLTLEDVRDSLLPGGNLREPLSSLVRADVVILREEEEDGLRAAVARSCGAEIWVVKRELRLPTVLPARVLAFCGIARPQGFIDMLSQAGCRPAAIEVFPDHHSYTDRDITRLLQAARHGNASGFITTAKDAVKLDEQVRERLGRVGPMMIAELHVCLCDEAQAMRTLQRVV